MAKHVMMMVFVLVGLTACGGGGGSSSSSSNNGEDNGPSNAVTRIIGHADSIDVAASTMTIDGVVYTIASNVEIELDGAPDYAEDLVLAQLTTDMALDIELNSAGDTVEEIEVEADVLGVATDVTEGQLTVNGQVFKHDLSTNIYDGDTVILTGFIHHTIQNDEETIWTVNSLSTFDPQTFVLHYGEIQNLSSGQRTFEYMNGPQVDYSNVHDDDVYELKNNALVEIEGDSYANGIIIANDLDLEDDDYQLSGSTNQMVEVEGVITEVGVGYDYIMLNNQMMVNVTEETIFETDDGVSYSVNDLVVGARIEVEMVVTETGYEAVEIEFED